MIRTALMALCVCAVLFLAVQIVALGAADQRALARCQVQHSFSVCHSALYP